MSDNEIEDLRGDIRLRQIAKTIDEFHENPDLRLLVHSDEINRLLELPKRVLEKISPLYCMKPIVDTLVATAIIPKENALYYKLKVQLGALLTQTEFEEDNINLPTEGIFNNLGVFCEILIDSAIEGERLKRVTEKVAELKLTGAEQKKKSIFGGLVK